MKGLITFLFIAFIQQIALSQNWQPITFDYCLYECKTNVVIDSPKIQFNKGEVLDPDFQLWFPPSQYVSSRIVGCDFRDIQNPCYNEEGACGTIISFISKTLYDYGNRLIVFNYNNDELTLPARLNDSDTILATDSLIYLYSLKNLTDTNILGTQDSIAVYEIIVLDSNDTVQSNQWHGETFSMTKNLGIYSTPSWYLFPNYKATFELLSHGKYGGTGTFKYDFTRYHNWKVGDLIEWEQSYMEYTIPAETLLFENLQAQCSISSLTTNSFSGNCKVKTTSSTFNQGELYHFNSIIKDSIFKFEAQSSLFHFTSRKQVISRFPSILPRSVNNYTTFYRNDHDQVEISSNQNSEQIIQLNDSCLIINEAFEPRHGCRYKGIAGIGEINWNSYIIDDPMPGSKAREEKFTLTYFKSDSIEYGAPGWPLGLEEPFSSEPQIKIFPNPVNDVLNINSNEQIQSVELYGISGALITSNQVNEFSTSVDFSNLSQGIYFLNIHSNTGRSTHKIIK